MKQLLKIILLVVAVFALASFAYWADEQDYFKSNYKDLTEQEKEIFKWRSEPENFDLVEVYRQHFTDNDFIFPRQQVTTIKLFKNMPLVGVFTGKTLKQNKVNSFIQFCNDTANFDWGETTWGLHEAEYFIRLYNAKNEVVGKIYFCLANCGHVYARPFSPSMKFGMLSASGLDKITQFIKNKNQWE